MNKLLFVLFLSSTFITTAQNKCEIYKEEYIPIDLNEAIGYFECKWKKDDLDKIKNLEERKFLGQYHLGTGRSIRNNWKLWAGTSELSKYFRDLGIHHPDDMSGIIMTSLHRKLNEKPIELEEQIKYYKDYWADAERKQKETEQKEFGEFNIGDKVEFLYEYDFISKKQEKKWMEDKCYAEAIITGLDKEKLEVQVKLKKSCDRKGIIISKYDVYDKIDGKYEKIKEDVIEIMKKGEKRWTSYKLWDIIE